MGPGLDLGVRHLLAGLIDALERAGAAVLVAPPGTGKTTLVPPALAAAGTPGRIVMLEPRRIAARAAARRIAELGGWRVGEEVGYQVRFERRAGPATRILVVTEGILVQMLQADPFLAGVGALIFDEFHERSLATDLALAMARRVQREVRPDLRLLVMSATFDPGPVAAWLGDCPILTATARLHPVNLIYSDMPPPGYAAPRHLPAMVAGAVRRALAATTGDVLAFLPGVGEILRTAEALADLATAGVAVLPLYGDLPAERQDAVLAPRDRSPAAAAGTGPGRKVVLATNVAESSITVPGVTAVVDSGLARRLRYDPGAGLDRLEVTRISRAAADQRAGRAGRQGPGLCLRLWPAHEHAARPAEETPEIARVDLAGPALQLLAWGEADLAAFGWFEPPAPGALAAARELLVRLGALAPSGTAGVTALGREMARLPVHPRLARLLLEGRRHGVARDAALAAALLAERDPFRRAARSATPHAPGAHSAHSTVAASRSDLLDRVDQLHRWEAAPGHGRGTAGAGFGEDAFPDSAAIAPAAARFVLRARDQLLRLVLPPAATAATATAATPATAAAPAPAAPGRRRDEGFLRALVAAYPDRVARRRAPHDRRGVMVGGRGVRLDDDSAVLAPPLFLCVDLTPAPPGPRAEDRVRLASEAAIEWLPAALVTTAVEMSWDTARERVTAMQTTRYEDLVLDEREVPIADPAAAAELLAAAAAARLETALALDEPEVASLLARWRCLAAWMPELALPPVDAAALAALVPEICPGCRSFAELRRAPLVAPLLGRLSWPQREALEREAPERLEVPSGSRIRLVYEPGKPPVLAARIQELFGLTETPRVAAGRVPVLLHLLAPNQRPQQVTDDLRSFWSRTYPEVRKELAGRYPRHAWPQDPWNAPAERRPRRPRSKP